MPRGIKRQRTALGEHIIKAREKIPWTQQELATASGISRSNVRAIETGQNKLPGANDLIKIATALKEDYQKVLLLAGYEIPENVQSRKKTVIDILEEATEAMPCAIPLYADLYEQKEKEVTRTLATIYWPKESPLPPDVEGIVVKGDNLPYSMKQNDTVIISRQLKPEKRDLLVCRIGGKTLFGYFMIIEGKEYIVTVNNENYALKDCSVVGIVLQIQHNLFLKRNIIQGGNN